ncbi:hypothetical protein OGAPHI_003291 [Ogataea philodendri]|uniref:Transcription elongation factor 1 homolog n=1 Tax=Ogataea philodendri TaxID=1378263 RepID=A0A9P8P7M9_9ASCO|nr:uncharacterized protein OGAPHI_003291 [Ogataea philodendri]KAH3666842.1 hypothetical protein OGAPHI_003291 [Ogataea philodendri]
MLSCKVCGQSFQSPINSLSQPIDIYSDWVDACEAVAERVDAKEEDDYDSLVFSSSMNVSASVTRSFTAFGSADDGGLTSGFWSSSYDRTRPLRVEIPLLVILIGDGARYDRSLRTSDRVRGLRPPSLESETTRCRFAVSEDCSPLRFLSPRLRVRLLGDVSRSSSELVSAASDGTAPSTTGSGFTTIVGTSAGSGWEVAGDTGGDSACGDGSVCSSTAASADSSVEYSGDFSGDFSGMTTIVSTEDSLSETSGSGGTKIS